MDQSEKLAALVLEAWKPPRKIDLVSWAEENRFLSSESSSLPGRWVTSKVEVARGPMHAITDGRIHTVSIMCCTQLMKTELILNAIGYCVHHDPSPILVLMPTMHMAEAFSKDRIDPMFRDSPALKDKLGGKKSRDGGNTILHKQFPGGHITMVGANAPGELAMRPVRMVFCDEVDKYPASAGDEGDPISLAWERAATFWNRKQILTCSPTIDGMSRIAASYAESDQRVFEPPCPHCGHREEMLWKSVKWESGKPESAAYHCPSCEKPWTEAERVRAIAATRFLPGFGWTAKGEFNGHAGFKVSKLASPWEPIPSLVRKFLKAEKNPQRLKVFVNTQLAETFKNIGEQPSWERLYRRREEYPRNVVPAGGVLIFAGADVQNDRIEVEIKAYGRDQESWSLDYRIFEGDTSDESAPGGPWARLSELITEHWPQAGTGVAIPLSRIAVDSGFNTQTVYRWCNRYPLKAMAIKGVPNQIVAVSRPKEVEMRRDGAKIQGSGKLWKVGVDLLKGELYARLKADTPIDGAPVPTGLHHWPEYGTDYFKQLTAEQMEERQLKGRTVYDWVKTQPRNEVLDCHIYCRAAAYVHGVDRLKPEEWALLESSLGADQIKRVQKKRKRSDYWER